MYFPQRISSTSLFKTPSLFIYRSLTSSLLKWHPTSTEPELWPWVWLSWKHWAGSHPIHIPNPLQKQCYHAHYFNTHKICLSACFPLPLHLFTVFTMYNTHRKEIFLAVLGAWLIQRPTTDKLDNNLICTRSLWSMEQQCLVWSVVLHLETANKKLIIFCVCICHSFSYGLSPYLSLLALSFWETRDQQGWTALGVKKGSDKGKRKSRSLQCLRQWLGTQTLY